MKMPFTRFKSLTVALNFFGSALFAVANAALPRMNIKSDTDFEKLVICQIAAWMFYILMAVSVIMVILAAYKYLTSAGDPNKVSGATKTITYAAVAIIVAILARPFASIVVGMVGGISAGSATGGVDICGE